MGGEAQACVPQGRWGLDTGRGPREARGPAGAQRGQDLPPVWDCAGHREVQGEGEPPAQSPPCRPEGRGGSGGHPHTLSQALRPISTVSTQARVPHEHPCPTRGLWALLSVLHWVLCAPLTSSPSRDLCRCQTMTHVRKPEGQAGDSRWPRPTGWGESRPHSGPTGQAEDNARCGGGALLVPGVSAVGTVRGPRDGDSWRGGRRDGRSSAEEPTPWELARSRPVARSGSARCSARGAGGDGEGGPLFCLDAPTPAFRHTLALCRDPRGGARLSGLSLGRMAVRGQLLQAPVHTGTSPGCSDPYPETGPLQDHRPSPQALVHVCVHVRTGVHARVHR